MSIAAFVLGADSLLHGVTCKSVEEISGTDNGNALTAFTDNNSKSHFFSCNDSIAFSTAWRPIRPSVDPSSMAAPRNW
jgi:hypothetical protein